MRSSAYRWRNVKIDTIFFVNCPILFLDWDNKSKLVSPCFSCFLEFLRWKKIKLSLRRISTITISLVTNLIKYVAYIAHAKKPSKNQVRRI